MKRSKGRKVALTSGFALLLLLPLVIWTSWPHILFLLYFESLGRNEQGFPEYRHRDSDVVFVSLPGGTFMMGSPDSEESCVPMA